MLSPTSLLLAVALAAPPRAAQGAVFLTVDEALELAFPDAAVTRRTEVLTERDQERVAKASGARFERRLVFPYVARTTSEDGEAGELLGTAYFDAHRVRSKRETLMVVVAPDNSVERIEVLAFAEPKDYLPRSKWLEQFIDEELADELRIGGAIRGITGATLSADAVTDCVRRVLALHELLEARRRPQPEPRPEPKPEPEEGGEGNGEQGGEAHGGTDGTESGRDREGRR